MSQQINIPVGADTSGFYSELKKAFDWAKREADSVRMGGGGFSGGGSYGSSKEGGIGSKVNSALNNRIPDPNRAGLHELGNGGFIRTFESQMQTAGYIAVKTQEMFQKASLRGISDWASKLGSSLKDIVSPLGRGAMGLAVMGGNAISSISLPTSRTSNRSGSGIDSSVPLIPESYDAQIPAHLPLPLTPYKSVPDGMKRAYPNNPLNLSEYDSRNNVIPTIHPRQDESGSVPSSGDVNRRGNSNWQNLPRDERGRFMSPTSQNSEGNNLIGGDKGYRITSNMVYITANIVHITTGLIQQGANGVGGSVTSGGSGNRTPTGKPPGLSSNITATPVPKPKPAIPPLLYYKGMSPMVRPQLNPQLNPLPIPNPTRQREKKDPLGVAGAREIFNPTSPQKHNPKPTLGERVKNGVNDLASGAGQMYSGVKGSAQSVAGAAAAVIGVAAIGLAVANAMAGVVSDLGEKYVQQAMKQSDTMGALGGRVGGGGSYFVNEEVARANIASGRISGANVYGKGNQISQIDMKFAASMGVGLTEMSSMLAHIRHAEEEAQTLDKIRMKGTLLGYKGLQMQQYMQKYSETAQQRTEKGLSSNFDNIVLLAKGAFDHLKPEGKLGAAQDLAGNVQAKFGANLLSDMIMTHNLERSGDYSTEGRMKVSMGIEKDPAGALVKYLNEIPEFTRKEMADAYYETGQLTALQSDAIKNWDGKKSGSGGKIGVSAIESAFQLNKTEVDPVRALANFLAGHENRQQAIFLNGVGATAYELSVKLQKQQMEMVKEHEKAFVSTADFIASMQSKIMGGTAKMIEFSTKIIDEVTAFLDQEKEDSFFTKLKKFMEDYKRASSNIDWRNQNRDNQ